MSLNLFLGGDVMLGRAVDQLFKYKNDATLYESYVKIATYYLPDAMKRFITLNGYVDDDYVWGDLLTSKLFRNADLKIINLETSVTTSRDHQNKAVLYKMHPGNINVIKVAGIDYCNLANNHVLDWGMAGLMETMATLKRNHIAFGGIGVLAVASSPTVLQVKNRKIYIYSFGDVDSGVPLDWAATDKSNGVDLVVTSNPATKIAVARHITKTSRDADLVIVSIHWGSNWGFEVPKYHQEFAHYLIDAAHVDLIHGHSSHHFRPIEVYNNKLILYGCGDLINDYETIGDHDAYFPHVNIAYYPSYNLSRQLIGLTLVPYTLKNLQLTTTTTSIVDKLNEISRKYHATFVDRAGQLVLE